MNLWSTCAPTICRGLLVNGPKTVRNPDQVNAMLASLWGAAHLIQAPRAYTDQAAGIEYDGDWGQVARATHIALATHSGDNQLRLAVATYYS